MALVILLQRSYSQLTGLSSVAPFCFCILLSLLPHFTFIRADKLYPCAFADTINITDNYHIIATNHSYIYDDVTIPHHLVAEYDFIIWQQKRQSVPTHLRACICQLKTCLHFCCPPAHFYDIKNATCHRLYPLNNTGIFNFLDDQKDGLKNGSTSIDFLTAFDKDYTVQTGTPCANMRSLTKHKNLQQLISNLNDTISRKNHTISKHYCLTPFEIETGIWSWQYLVCAADKLRFVLGVLEWTYAICLMITIICLIITLIAYTWCNQLRKTFYGFAIQAYSVCVIVGYSLLTHLILNDPKYISKEACLSFARYALIFLLLSFFILNLIGLNFYLRFNGILLSRWNFCLGILPMILLTVGWSYYVSSRTSGNGPVLGNSYVCWFDPRDWTIMVYFYVPIMISFAIGGFLYIITLVQLYEQQDAQMKQLRLFLERKRFKSFWQYSAYNFIAWLALIIIFVLNYYSYEQAHISYTACFFASLQGFGALHALIGKNDEIRNWLRGIDKDVEEAGMNKSAEEEGVM